VVATLKYRGTAGLGRTRLRGAASARRSLTQVWGDPLAELAAGCIFGELLGGVSDFGRYPARKGNRAEPVCPGFRMLLVKGRDARAIQETRQPDESGPEPAMDVGNLSEQAAHQNLLVLAHRSRRPKDVPALLVSPPAAADGSARNGFRKIWSRSSTALEHDAVLLDELYGIHEYPSVVLLKTSAPSRGRTERLLRRPPHQREGVVQRRAAYLARQLRRVKGSADCQATNAEGCGEYSPIAIGAPFELEALLEHPDHASEDRLEYASNGAPEGGLPETFEQVCILL
jgi:hypothetical protein